MTPRAKMDKATALLLRDYAFWGSLVLNLKVVERTDLPFKTLATDGVHLMYNPDYVEAHDLTTLITDIAHETGHVMFLHPLRRGQRDPKMWNMAGDYVVNDFLTQSKFKLGSDYLYDPKYHGMDAEKIYDLLWKNPEQQPQQCGCGGLHDHPGEKRNGNGKPNQKSKPSKSNGGSPSTSQTEAAVRTALAQARAFAKVAGQLSLDIDRAVEEILNPRMKPEDILRQFLERSSADDYTWQVPSRHHQHLGLYLPSMSSESIPEIVFVIDTSGSIPQSTMAKCAGWISEATAALPIQKVHVVYCDAAVKRTDTYDRNDLPIGGLHPVGGGGTNFQPPFKWITDQGIEPKAVVYLTDLICNSYPEPPTYPVLWLVYGSGTRVPFGEVVRTDE